MVNQEEREGVAEGLEMSDADGEHRGQYSDAVLNELESQNEQQVEGIMGKVKLLKDVQPPLFFFFFHLPILTLYVDDDSYRR